MLSMDEFSLDRPTVTQIHRGNRLETAVIHHLMTIIIAPNKCSRNPTCAFHRLPHSIYSTRRILQAGFCCCSSSDTGRLCDNVSPTKLPREQLMPGSCYGLVQFQFRNRTPPSTHTHSRGVGRGPQECSAVKTRIHSLLCSSLAVLWPSVVLPLR